MLREEKIIMREDKITQETELQLPLAEAEVASDINLSEINSDDMVALPLMELSGLTAAEIIEQSVTQNDSKFYGTGYGYNVIKSGYCESFGILNRILNFEEIAKCEKFLQKPILFDSVVSEQKGISIIGRTIRELSSELLSNASVKGKGFGFSASLSVGYDESRTSSSDWSFAYFRDVYALVCRTLDQGILEFINKPEKETGIDFNKLLSRDFKEALYSFKTLDPKEKYIEFLDRWGTHLICDSYMGGYIEVKTSFKNTGLHTKSALRAAADMAYRSYLTVKADTKKDEQARLEDSLFTCSCSVRGGDQSFSLKQGAGDAQINEWSKTIRIADPDQNERGNVMMVNFKLLPIWEIIPDNISLEEDLEQDNVEKQKEFEMQESNIAEEKSKNRSLVHVKNKLKECFINYSNEIKYPDDGFIEIQTNQKFDKTLVKTIITSDGRSVAQMCEEWIDDISRDKRVLVIYPLVKVNGILKVDYLNGLFVGDDNHSPQRVIWKNGQVSLESVEIQRKGKLKIVYLQGPFWIFEIDKNENKVVTSWAEDEFLRAPKDTDHRDHSYNYPIVKIGDRIYTRENYASYYWGNDKPIQFQSNWEQTYDPTYKFVRNVLFYSGRCIYHREQLVPNNGWRVPTKEDSNAFINYVKKTDRIIGNGVTGFNMELSGYVNDRESLEMFGSHVCFWCSLKDNKEFVGHFIRGVRNQNLELYRREHIWAWGCPVRLVRDANYAY